VSTPPADTPNAGDPDDGSDAGTDAGTDDTTPALSAGPWPTTPVLDYTTAYGLGFVQSVGVDDAYNIWLLSGERIGVLRPGTNRPVWVGRIGQAAPGFGIDKLATYSTVICGGAANQAYVGYATTELLNAKRDSVQDPEFLKGDMDVVQLDPNGTISLTEHLSGSAGTSQPWPPLPIGIHNTNDWHYDEDRTVLVCRKVMRGRDKGDLYIGTNHGVTRIRGLLYDSHRHPAWYDSSGALRMGYSWGLGIGQNGDVLIANDWKVGIAAPPAALVEWEDMVKVPWALDTFNQALNALEEFDFWRGFEQTADGTYYLGSSQYGLWQMTPKWVSEANWVKIGGMPTDRINALAATDDGSLYIGTDDAGLWRMDAQKKLSRVSGVSGSRVRENGLVYDPTVAPATLYVLTNEALTVLRGP
jgi:hypothetical protein